MTKAKKSLGQLLLEDGLIDEMQLRSALGMQKRFGGRFASHCLAMGFLPERSLAIYLSKQYGVPAVHIGKSIIRIATSQLVPRDIAFKYTVLPAMVDGGALIVAMANPHDLQVLNELQFVTGKRIIEHVAVEATVRDTIDRVYTLGVQSHQEFLVGNEVDMGSTRQGPNGYLEIVTAEMAAKAAAAARIDPPNVTFSRLTINEEVFDERLAQPVQRTGASRRRILVIEDDEEISKMLTTIMEKAGHEVLAADRGLQALQMIKAVHPDLILLDAMLPEVHGFDVCRKVKQSQRFGHIPVIMLSAVYRGWRFEEDVKKLYGADCYIEKPFNVAMLLQSVKALLEGRAAQPTAERQENISRDAEALYGQAIALHKEGKTDDAIQTIRQAGAIDPMSPKISFLLANLYFEKKLIYQAIAEYERTIALAPEFFAALKTIAVLYQKLGFVNKAAEMWERALKSCRDTDMREKIKEHLIRML
ncbi:MAG: response regulator [Deltaproteobacteria bacterium]|nr:response regulator [Deltaproteobacteria bacterium]